MKDRQSRDNPQPLESFGRRLAQWREGRSYQRSRIPEELWAEATKLGRRYGVYRTSQALGLDYSSVRARVESSSNRTSRGVGKPTFVEVPLKGSGIGECVVELESRSGSKLRVQLNGAAVSEVSALARLFYESE